jgi:hypothetical protein
MASLSQGVSEREYAHYGLPLLGAAVVLLVRLRSWKGARSRPPCSASFPLVFLADTFFWLYHFGHRLDPRAPLHIPAFTPQLFGNGNIGQFMTFAAPERGFGLSVAAALLLVLAAVLRWREVPSCCRGCAPSDGHLWSNTAPPAHEPTVAARSAVPSSAAPPRSVHDAAELRRCSPIRTADADLADGRRNAGNSSARLADAEPSAARSSTARVAAACC